MAQTFISQDGLGQFSILYGLVTVSITNGVMHTQSMTLPSRCTNYRVHCVKGTHAIMRYSRIRPVGVESGGKGARAPPLS